MSTTQSTACSSLADEQGFVIFVVLCRSRLMLAAGTTVDKSLLVPFVALQAPSGVTFWAR
jgi:hypothetical protein